MPELLEGDALVLAALAEHGSDLRKFHSIENFLYFETDESAALAGAACDALGYRTEVSAEALSFWKRLWRRPRCVCICTKEMVPTAANIAEMREQLEAVAQRFGGEYDGWGSAIVE